MRSDKSTDSVQGHESRKEREEEHRKEEIAEINKRTGRNMGAAIRTGTLLVLSVILVLLWSAHVFTYMIVLFMLVAIWELTIDFGVADIRLPLMALWISSTATLLLTWYVPQHFLGLSIGLLCSVILVSLGCAIDRLRGPRIPPFLSRFVSDARKRANKALKKPEDADFVSPAREGETFTGSLRDLGSAFLVTLYVPLLASFLVLMLTQPGYQWRIFIAIFVPALSDTGGLIFGAAFGKHKLSPRISPKKSYEGLAGSALFAMVGASLFYGFGFPSDYLAMGWWKPLVLGLVITLVGTVGDLSASMLKRDLGIKDMGYILLGHGGVMDRVDSILLSAPFTYSLLTLFGV